MAKRRKRPPLKALSVGFDELARASAAFTDRTRVVENTLSTREEVWRLGFDNGSTIVISSDGTWRIMKE